MRQFRLTGRVELDEVDMSVFIEVRKKRFGHLPVTEDEDNRQMKIIIKEWMAFSIDNNSTVLNHPEI